MGHAPDDNATRNILTIAAAVVFLAILVASLRFFLRDSETDDSIQGTQTTEESTDDHVRRDTGAVDDDLERSADTDPTRDAPTPGTPAPVAPPRFKISGILVRTGDDAPVPGVRLYVRTPEDDFLTVGTTDAEGRFASERILPAGVLDILASKPGRLGNDLRDLHVGEVALQSDRDDVRLIHPWDHAVRGRVVTSAGDGIPGARVRIGAADIRPAVWTDFWGVNAINYHGMLERTSDDDGRFSFETLPKRPLCLFATKKGLVPNQSLPLPTDLREEVEIVLHRPATIVGDVRTTAGDPVTRVTVQATPRLGRPGNGEVDVDGEGRFRLELLPPGQHHLVASKDTVFSDVVEVTVAEGETAGARILFDAAMTPRDMTISGVVVNADDEPQDGVSVQLQQLDVEKPTHRFEFLRNAGGRFTFRELPAGRYRLTAGKGILEGRVRTEVVAGASDVRLVLPSPMAKLAVTITEKATGKPVEGATIFLFCDQEPHPDVAKIPTFQGTWSAAVHPGTFELTIMRTGLTTRTVTVPVPPDSEETHEVAIALEPGTPRRGRVVDAEGHPVASARVAQISPDPWHTAYLAGLVTTDAQGYFTITGLPREGGWVALTHDNGSTWMKTATKVTAAEILIRKP